jgi:2-hydroxychromene-2-carboxylate isomerase
MILEFWYEFASAYAYPAAWRIERAAGGRGIRVIWRPFLLAPLLRRRQGLTDELFDLGAAEEAYLWRDMERVCRREMLPFRRPTVYPRRTLAAARLAAVGLGRGWTARFSRSVFAASFGEDRDIASRAVLGELLQAAGGDPSQDLVEADSEGAKSLLRANGAEAERKGLFGSPSFYCYPVEGGGGELFWGNHRLEEAVAFAADRDHATGS